MYWLTSLFGIVILVGGLGVSSIQAAADVTEVTVEIEATEHLPDDLSPVLVRFVPELAGRVTGARPDPLDVMLEPGGTTDVRLRSDLLWAARVEDPQLWSPEVIIDPVRQQGPVSLSLFPTGKLEAPVVIERLGSIPEQIELRFEPSGDGNTLRKQPKGVVDCAISDAVVRCAVPSAPLDLRFSAPPYAPVYRRDVAIPPGDSRTVDPLHLVQGASVSGEVIRENGDPAPEGTRVRLTLASGANLEEHPELRLISSSIETDAGGFFQFRGVQPGHYRVVAEAPGYAPAAVAPIETRPDLESALFDPLVLRRPAELVVEILPERDPWDRPWTLRLVRRDAVTGGRSDSIQEPASSDGLWKHGALSPGRYWITVIGSRESQWIHQEIEVLRDGSPVVLQILMIEIEGTLTRGDEPAPGELWFGGTDNVRRVSFEVDEDGDFRGLLPSPGEWPLEWLPAAGHGEFEIALEPVEVPDRARVSLALEIPDTRLAGEVVNEGGEGIPRARVSFIHLENRDEGAEVQTESAGEFSLFGLQPGTYAVEAHAADGSSEQVQIQVAEGRDAPPLRLVVRRMVQITGQIHAGGRPVPGARILAWPDLGSAPGVSVLETVSGPRGFFDLEAPASSVFLSFLVYAQGHAISLTRQTVSSEALTELELDPYAGTLILEGLASDPSAFLVHGGTFLPVQSLVRVTSRWSGGSERLSPTDDVVLTNLEPGRYSVCSGQGVLSGLAGSEGPPESGCNSGALPPFGELRIERPTPRAAR